MFATENCYGKTFFHHLKSRIEALDVSALKTGDDPAIIALGHAAELYQELMLEQNALDFSGIQAEALRLLEQNPSVLAEVRAQLTHLMVDEYGFDQPEDEAELTTNQRFEKLTRLEQLGIYVDEAHHAFGKDLAKDMGIGAKPTDTSLRTTIDKLAAKLRSAGTQVVACFNYTGTPYVGRLVLPEVVYAYGLKEAISNEYLKKVDLKGYSNTRTAEFVKIAVDDFCDQTDGLQPEGLLPKMAFFAATIEEAENELKAAVEAAIAERGIPSSRILVNTGNATNDEERAFRRLDYAESEKQFIILVNKGREGWNCRSLFGVALYRQPKSKVFVLQASMRCLRAIEEGVQHTGHIYLSQDNLAILDSELEQNFRMTVEDLKGAAKDKEVVEVRVNEPVKIKIKRVRRSFHLEEKVLTDGAELGFNMSDKAAWANLTDDYRLLATQRNELGPAKASDQVTDLTAQRTRLIYSPLMIVSEVARYLNRSPIEVEGLLASSKQGMAATIEAVNAYNELLHDLVIPRLFAHLYSLNPEVTEEEYEVELVKIPAEGFYRVTAAKDKIVRETDPPSLPVAHKSFHLDTYCFDSNPEQTLFWDLLREGKRRQTSRLSRRWRIKSPDLWKPLGWMRRHWHIARTGNSVRCSATNAYLTLHPWRNEVAKGQIRGGFF